MILMMFAVLFPDLGVQRVAHKELMIHRSVGRSHKLIHPFNPPYCLMNLEVML